MKLKVLGAAGTVTGSSYVLTASSGQAIMIDLGMFQGIKEIEAMNFQPFDYDCSQLSGAILTHAHLDHCGRLPMLMDMGFDGPIWMTSATLSLARLVLMDSAKIAQKDKKRALYDQDKVEQTLDKAQTASYHQQIHLGDFRITFFNAGHLLGAASVLIKDTSSPDGHNTIVFSGDLGNRPEDLLQDGEFFESADFVVMESTYGDRLHGDTIPEADVAAQIQAVEAHNGVVMIPTFSLEKTQEILHIIKHLKEKGHVAAETSVYMDSPMAQKATSIYLSYPELFNEHLQKEVKNDQPFEFPGLHIVQSHQDSLAIHDKSGPMVILAGAGMMNGGRIVSHAARFLPDPNNRIFFVGYQGEETLGRAILEGTKKVMINKKSVSVNATVTKTSAMSAHADQQGLLDWLAAIKGIKKVFLTHGDDLPRAALAQRINSELNISDITLPFHNQEIDI